MINERDRESAQLVYVLGMEDAQSGCNPRDDNPDYAIGYNDHRLSSQPIASVVSVPPEGHELPSGHHPTQPLS